MEEIKRLREKREIEATLKKLSSKMQCILQNIGQPIISQYSANTVFDSEGWLTEEERRGKDDIQILDEDEGGYCIGHIYDSLSLGKNIEIKYMIHERELKATFNGRVVYKEVEGVLEGYVPSQLWEETIEKVYLNARQVEERKAAQDKEKKRERATKNAIGFIQKLRDAWGF